MNRESIEYLKFKLADRDGEDLSLDTVVVALYANQADARTWLPCTYMSATTMVVDGVSVTAYLFRTTSVITWTVANYPASRYTVEAKATDSPETPATKVGVVTF